MSNSWTPEDVVELVKKITLEGYSQHPISFVKVFNLQFVQLVSMVIKQLR